MEALTAAGRLIAYPGFLFTVALGMLASWVDRKVTARVQWRVGPPLLQPLYDVVKLLGKETIVPADGLRWLFLAAPAFALATSTVAATLIWRSQMAPGTTFVGDVIVALYLLTGPAVALVVGAFASRNPLASVGGSREMKLVLSYELPLLLCILVAVIKTGSLSLGAMHTWQVANGAVATSPSGILALIVAVMCVQAKLGLVPFDMAEAETEIMGGALIEYSGPPLGLFKLTRFVMLTALPLLVACTLLGGVRFDAGPVGFLLGLGKVVVLWVVATLIRNTNPRVRVDQALWFFWGPMTIIAAAAVALGMLGH